MFRVKKSVPVDRDGQGYIYFKSRLYRRLPPDQQKEVVDCCMEAAGGDYYQALFEFVTTDAGATEVCLRHHLSRSTLERIVRKYYINFPIET